MREFRPTCLRHEKQFVAAVRRGGCDDPAKVDALRQKTLAWLAARFPRMVLDHFNEKSCLGCALEANGVDAAEIERVITDLARGRPHAP